MKQKAPKREKWLTIRLSEEEYTLVEKLTKKTTCRTLSDYGRKVLLVKPINVKYRNQSLDDFLADMLQLKKELNAIGNNFNQAVHRLHTLQSIPDLQSWVMLNEQDKTTLFRMIETISNKINDAYQLWSHA